MPSASQTRRRELARLKARREAERRRARRRRAVLLYGSIGVVVLVLAVVGGGLLRAGDKPKPAAPAAAQDARADAPTAPATVACGGKTPPKVNRPKLDRPPKSQAQANQRYEATLTTSCGAITFLLDPKAAPITTYNFVYLSQRHFYDSTWLHRIVPGGPNNIGVIQGGDPQGTGEGGPGYSIKDELPKGKSPYKKYTVAMANSGPNSGGSQFFISTQDNRLDSNYALFGKVIKGQDVVDKIAKLQTAGERGDTPTEAVWIEKVAISIT